MKRFKTTRRSFIKGSAFIASTATGAGLFVADNPELEAASATGSTNRTTALAQCPYCGVGCGTIIQTENGKIVSMRPDKDHPTNYGLQCIKGLTAAEPMYVDRMEGEPYVRKDVWEEWNKPGHGDLGFISNTKGSFDEEHFVRIPYEAASDMVAHKIVHYAKEYGGNSVALYGSGQLTMEGQYLENLFMKGVLGSNTIEANARMCMTSAVTGYFSTLGSDTPPLAYEDIELADMIMHFGHNARESHPIVYWRCADHKKKNDITTVVVDPRNTGTTQGYNDINPDNNFHVPILNGDISFLNALAHVLLKEHDDVVDWEFVKAHVNGWENYVSGVLKEYSPEQVQDRMGGDVPPELIRQVAGQFADATRKRLQRSKGSQSGDGHGGVIVMWGIGFNQHLHGQHNVISIINLLALTGNLAKPGCGPFSMTGQPNAMGERFTGGLTGRLPFNQPLSNETHRAHMAKHWRVPEENLIKAMNSPNPGFAVGMHERALKGEVKAMFWVYATHIDLPDQYNLIRPALLKTFNVVQEIYRHAPNNLYADVIFPAATWGEVEGVYISSERRININQKAAQAPRGCRPDMDMVIDKGKEIAHLLGLNADAIFPYQRKEDGSYDAQEVFRDVIRASEGTDTDLTGILEVEKIDNIEPYEQLARLRGIQWPAPTYGSAREGGIKRRFMMQEGDWSNRPYGYFRTQDGKVHMKLCHQDYSDREAVTKKLMAFGQEEGLYTIDHLDLMEEARDKGLTPDLPDESFRGRKWQDVPKDKYPYWMGLGVVYEHFHTAKSNRSPTTRRLVPEMYVEMHEEDARDLGIKDGEKVRVISRRGSLEARAQVGLNSLVKPARNSVPRGYMFGPWNLSVADSADPKKNKWLANGISSRIWDPVSGQVDFKKLACRIEKV
ncbi:MAG: molybdopterin-dependent oxidoreductase [Gammaproteobacteria bacterium]|jgi:nitrate reductase NapA|nr:molybdopterin-dependent oxidoreductase [Gammaproteobacteria bacterium]MBT3866623.1 molybdopterin-dependent oxidoreductase [Gammaproteobacteria bacterium]MBT4615595.1 molybdopterin-dependent oxidoreductase [Gammaproteobacteria bacterium]MBT5198559.1 molybdopterin-dependent oxidoreductase [Gammaproteobacteria bacterium]MBT5443268.1 molybdopterin-dependent oxidoreductase [Gammaproteobacteria bacterium]